MDNNNWTLAQVGGEPSMDTGDWRTQSQNESRQRVVNQIMDTLKRHVPISGQKGLQELKEIAMRFEEKIYAAATSQSDYIRRITLKMLKIESNSITTMANSLPSNSAFTSKNAPDAGSLGMQSQIGDQGLSLPIPMAACQAQASQKLSSLNIQNNMTAIAFQGSSSLTSAMPPVGGLPQTSLLNVEQNTNLQYVQSISGVSQISVANAIGQVVSANTNANTLRQIQERQEVLPQQQQQRQKQSQITQHGSYVQRVHQQPRQKNQQGNIPNSLMQSQQNLPQSSQQSVVKPNPGHQQNQQSSVRQSQPMLQQNPQSLLTEQQEMQLQSIFPQLQQQQLLGKQPNSTSMNKNQQIGHQNSMAIIKQQQHLRLPGQQNNLPNLQQQLPLQLMGQQQFGPQSNVSGLQQEKQQQQQLLGTQSGNSGMEISQHTVHNLQNKVPKMQQNKQNAPTLLLTQGHPSQQSQMPQQQVMSQIQSQPGQLLPQLGLQQLHNSLNQDMQQRLQTSGPLLQSQNMIDQQKQPTLSQRPIPEAPSTSSDSTAQTGNANNGDWQEEVYQKITAMKVAYLPELNEMYQKIAGKLQQHDTPPQLMKNEQLEKIKILKALLEHIILFLQVSKNNILPSYKEKLGAYEEKIVKFINSNGPRRPGVPMQQVQQLPSPHMPFMQQPQQQQSQKPQMLSHENSMNSQVQSLNVQGSVNTMQQNNVSSLQHNSLSSLSGVPNASHSMIKSLQSNSNSAVGSTLHNTVSASPQFIPKLQAHQIPQLHQMNDVDLKMRQQMGIKPGVFEQNHSASHRSVYHHQQLKSGAQFPISSPQLLQAASPEVPQHPSPQIDQQNLLPSLTKTGTPLQYANSPVIVPSSSTPLAQSQIPGETEKVTSGVLALPKAGNVGSEQTATAATQAQSFAIGAPGISGSPLLGEFTIPDGTHGNQSTVVCVTEKPLDRVLKVVKSISPYALSTSLGEIGSVVSMIDGIPESEPVNGSRAAISEDFASMTRWDPQARNGGTKKRRCYTRAMPVDVVLSAGSTNDRFKCFTGTETSDLESTVTSSIKRPRFKVSHALLEELREINQRLIDTVVDISDEDVDLTAAPAAASEGGEGTIVSCCSFAALSPNLKLKYDSGQMSPIQPLRLFVPTVYPNSSPILLDKFPTEVSKENEDISAKAKSRFSRSLRNISRPMSLGEIASTWDMCARVAISDYAQQNGGGSFSSKYGTWESCSSAA